MPADVGTLTSQHPNCQLENSCFSPYFAMEKITGFIRSALLREECLADKFCAQPPADRQIIDVKLTDGPCTRNFFPCLVSTMKSDGGPCTFRRRSSSALFTVQAVTSILRSAKYVIRASTWGCTRIFPSIALQKAHHSAATSTRAFLLCMPAKTIASVESRTEPIGSTTVEAAAPELQGQASQQNRLRGSRGRWISKSNACA